MCGFYFQLFYGISWNNFFFLSLLKFNLSILFLFDLLSFTANENAFPKWKSQGLFLYFLLDLLFELLHLGLIFKSIFIYIMFSWFQSPKFFVCLFVCFGLFIFTYLHPITPELFIKKSILYPLTCLGLFVYLLKIS